MSIGNKIKQLRDENNMTQKEIAEILEVEPGTISKYESNLIEPNIKSLIKLSDAFQVTIDELIRDENEEYDFDVSEIDLLATLKEQKEMKLRGNLYHNTQILFAYNSNHIDGNKLTQNQVKHIFENNSIIVDGSPVADIDDIVETINHFELFDYVLDAASKKLTETMIKAFHQILKGKTTDSKQAEYKLGDYKTMSNSIGEEKTSTPKQTSSDMVKLLEWYNSLSEITFEKIIEFHMRFEKIHPFQNGNGKVGRMIMFKECLKNDIIPFIILDKDKIFYFRGLNEFLVNKEKEYLIDTCLSAQEQYSKIIEKYLK